MRKLTIIILINVTLLLIGYDIYTAVNQVSGDTISQVVRDMSLRYVMIEYLIGLLIGHWFVKYKKRFSPWWVFAPSSLVLIFDILRANHFWWEGFLIFFFGMIVGFIFWPMRR